MAASSGSGAAGSGSTLLGTNSLQRAVDTFTAAVDKLDGLVASTKGILNTPALPSNSSGSSGSSPQSGQPNNPYTGTGTIKPVYQYNNSTGQSAPTGAYSFSYSGNGANGGGPTVNGQPATPSNSSTTKWPSAPTSGNGGWRNATVGGAALGFASSITRYGQGQLADQAAISAYVQQGSLFAPLKMVNGTSSGQLRNVAYGSGSGQYNTIANNLMDATQGQAYINSYSGAFASLNAGGAAMKASANAFGFTNPSMGYLGSAQLAGQMYSPTMAMAMMQMGYGVNSRGMGAGKYTSAPSVLGGMLQTWYGSGKVPIKNLAAGMGPNGHVTANLAALGYSGQGLVSMENTIGAYDRLANAGYSNGQISGIFNGAATKNQTDLSELSAAGIKGSVLQTLKDRNSIMTGRSSETSTGFQAGLSDSVGLLNAFNSALNHVLHGWLGTAAGYGSGIGAGKSLLQPFASGGASGSTGSRGQSPAKPSTPAGGSISAAAIDAVGWAEQEIGDKYAWGGDNPETGFDCSGLPFWAYRKAGVNIARTSQEQWASLKNRHAVALDQVQEGDLVFQAGGDGNAVAPGHAAMMISHNTIIESPAPGMNVRIRAYNPREWQHAGRPTGPGTPGIAPTGMAAGGAGSGSSGAGNLGLGFGGYGSTEEVDAVTSALGGGFIGAGSSGVPNASSSDGVSNGGTGSGGSPVAAAPANPSANAKLAKQLASARGWTGNNWNSLYALWTGESGFSASAWNRSGAYGIAQALGHGNPGDAATGPRSVGASTPARIDAYPSKAANSGDARSQEMWGLSYISQVYKDPDTAYAKWLSRSPHWYGAGTNSARPGVALVGDRGPELISLQGGEGIKNAQQTRDLLAGNAGRPAQAPWTVLGGGRTSGSGKGGVTIQLNFGANSIVISGVGSASDVSSSAREIAQDIGKYLAAEQIVREIASGVSSGC